MCGIDYPRLSESVNHPLLPKITETRLDRFWWGPYASQHANKLLDRARHDTPEHVRMTYWSAPGDSKPTFQEGVSALKEGAALRKGHQFGPSWTNHWVRVDLSIPPELRDAPELIFEFDPSCEALIFDLEGTPLHAITGGKDTETNHRISQEDRRVEHIIPLQAIQKGEYSIVIEVSCNGLFGVGSDGYRYQLPEMDRMFPLAFADIVVPNVPVRGLNIDFRILSQIATMPDASTSSLSQRALKACNDIMSSFIIPEDESAEALDEMVNKCRAIGWEVLGELSKTTADTCVHKQEDRPAHVWGIGHCHIDTAWLWRYTQTQQKVARSWSTQCDIMDRWANHQFAASSAQQYTWLEELYPKGFARVKQYVEEGRFHPVGGAWLEHDCMIPSGEALVRQYLYGQRYFKSRFGRYCREAWLPDSFGYSTQLPQILRLAGLNYFFTQKLSWNNINTFPYTSFNWVALDGSQVLAHMTPVDTYNAQCNYPELWKGVSRNKNLGVTDECLLLFGNGDGGGGPTPKMLQKLERLSSLGQKEASVPSLKMGSPEQFFDHLLEKTGGGKKLPTWRGELYFEFHRGIYTTQANIKKGNRNMETLLRDLEYFATLASLLDKSYKYPKLELDEMWKDTLLNQFHDVLPGTTISMVVDDALAIYEKREAQAKGLIKAAISVLAEEGTDTVLDPLRMPRAEVVDLNGRLGWLSSDGSGIGSLSSPKLSSPRASTRGEEHIIENSHFRLIISQGRITSLVDKRINRELIKAGPGSQDGGMVIFEDYPLQYDAWDVEIYHLDSAKNLLFDSVEVKEQPLRASLLAKCKFGKSSATLTFSLDATSDEGDSFIRVGVNVDWHEQHKFLKFALPVDIHSPSATYATQFGLVERPTHRNTTLDQAKFEVCAHGFADLSEAGYGISLASRYKYGYAVEGNTMRLSMLRSSTTPDPTADQGAHSFEFAIMPHKGVLAESSIRAAAARFNNELYTAGKPKGDLAGFRVENQVGGEVVLETIKRGEEDTDKTLVLRMYEAAGGRTRASLVLTNLPTIAKAEWVNILEHPFDDPNETECKITQSGGEAKVELDVRCFEIKTLKLTLG